MSSKFKDTAPAVYSWLKNIDIDKADEPAAGSLLLVLVENSGDVPSVRISKAGMKAQTAEFLNDCLKKSLWQGKSDSTIISTEANHFLCLPHTPSKNISQSSRQLGLDLAAALKALQTSHLSILSSDEYDQGELFIGLANGLYQSTGFKSQPENSEISIKRISFLGVSDTKEIIKALDLARGQIVCRHIGDAPPNWLTPITFAEVAEELGKDLGFNVKVLGDEEIESESMGALQAVAQGSNNKPRVICIEIDGESSDKTCALVGKGLTFDAGGISIKPSSGMEEMKYDMCGGAAVLGAAVYLSQHKPKNKVVALIGAVENMPGGKAARPGDVVTSRSGKTIEIINTDAEGRLVLIDVIDYAKTTYKPEVIIDVATLTGACLVALGSVGAAVMANDQGLANMLLETSLKTGEPLWQLPLWEEFDKELKSTVADYKNLVSANVKAGTITAGAFLCEFAKPTRWAHVDIAGTGWNCAAHGYAKAGGSGYGVALLAEACNQI